MLLWSVNVPPFAIATFVVAPVGARLVAHVDRIGDVAPQERQYPHVPMNAAFAGRRYWFRGGASCSKAGRAGGAAA
jgi:hypothetical protein